MSQAGIISVNSSAGGAPIQTLSDEAGNVVHPSGSPANIELVGYLPEQSGNFQTVTGIPASHLFNINPMSSARWIVDPLGFNGTHTTIGAAMAAASPGDTIFIMPGIYTENITMTTGVNLTANVCDSFQPNETFKANVLINGKITFTGGNSCSISNIAIQTNNDYCIVMTINATQALYFINCYIYALNHNAINYASNGMNNVLNLFDCTGSIYPKTPSLSLFDMPSQGGTFNIYNCNFNSESSAVAPSTISNSGTLNVFNSSFKSGFISSGSANVNIYNSVIDTSGSNTAGFTAGSSGINNIVFSELKSGTASAIAVNSSASIINCDINTTNSTAISGSGTLSLTSVSFSNTGSTILPTLSQNIFETGSLIASGGLSLEFTSPGSYPYTALPTDHFISVNTSSTANTIKLPNAPSTNQTYVIKDASGNAAVHNISVTTVGGSVTIDGQTTYTLSNNYQAISVIFSGSAWEVF